MTTEALDYQDGDALCHGRIALPGGSDRRPGIAVFADIGGVGEHTIRWAEQLASELGYVALAADTYGEGLVPKDMFGEGLPLVNAWKADPPRFVRRGAAALAALTAHPRCDGRTGAIGFCFGGSMVLELARHGHPGYLGCASFHGDAATPQPASKPIDAKLLVLHGAEDPLMTYDVLTKFLGEMAAVKADCQTICYTGIVHSFTNRNADGSMGFAKYDETTTRRAWAAMAAHFAEVFA